MPNFKSVYLPVRPLDETHTNRYRQTVTDTVKTVTPIMPQTLNIINRLTVYSYLTRYATGYTESDQMFTECLPGKKALRFFVTEDLIRPLSKWAITPIPHKKRKQE